MNTGYSIVFCDIDGTLVDSSHRVSPETANKIRQLARCGIPFILVSARMPSGILPIQNMIGINTPIICYSGALTLGGRGERLGSTGIGREKAIGISEYIRRGWKRISCGAFSFDKWLVDDTEYEWVRQERLITSSAPVKAGIAEAVPEGGCVHKFLCMGEPGDIAELGPELKRRFPGLAVHRSKETYLEIMDGAASKSAAIKRLCESYGIPVEASVSFGDNYNDIDMLQATGYSFAMGNAPDEVKRHAKAVAPDNDSNGVLAGLNTLYFAKEVT